MQISPFLRLYRRAPHGIPPAAASPTLGVLGGAFNPVTEGHLALARQAQKSLLLDEVLFVLPEQLPHRQPEEASFADRLAMLEVALLPSPRFSLATSTHGLFLDIARALEPHYPPATRLFFLIGSDAAERILRWDFPDQEASLREMFSRLALVVAGRAGKRGWPQDPQLAPFASCLHTLEMPLEYQHLSASRVREACQQGQTIEGLVPAAVAAYIREKNLYTR